MIIKRDPAATQARITRALQTARQAAVAAVNTLTNAARAPFVTDILGQDMIYLRKEAEAAAWLADPAPVLTNYPYLAQETGLTAPTTYELAQLWLNKAHMLTMLGAVMEGLRHAALADIAAASSRLEIDAALVDAAAQLEALK